MAKPSISSEKINTLFDSPFVKVYGMEYEKNLQYINASRRSEKSLPALKSDEAFKKMLPDAVSCIVILDGEKPKLLLSYEFRYTVGQFLLSIPAGLIDKADDKCDNPLIATAIRELKEETNIDVSSADRIEVVNPLLFSSPGMTDESNGIVSIVIADNSRLELSQDGAKGPECFDGFSMVTIEEARRILKKGTDDKGIFYSVYTWIALMYFVSEMWKQ